VLLSLVITLIRYTQQTILQIVPRNEKTRLYQIKTSICSKNRTNTRRRHILDEARIRRKERKTYRRLCAERKVRKMGRESGRDRVSKRGASQLAHTSPLERPREGKRGPGTGNLLLYTRPEIRMYHSRIYVGSRGRTNGLSLD